MKTATKKRALNAAGAIARRMPSDRAQLFAFMASPAVRADPWPLYQRLHTRGPVRPGPYNTWLVASHAAVSTVLRHPVTTVDESRAAGMSDIDRTRPFSKLIGRTLLFTDPPEHARLRHLVSRNFTPRAVEPLRDRIVDLAEQTLARITPQRRCDLIADFALPFPVAVISELLGVPEAERPRMLRWAQHLAPRLDIDLFRSPETDQRGDEAATELSRFLGELIAEPRRLQPDGLIAVLAEDETLAAEEIIALAALLLVAGFETTTNLIANSIHTLLDHPDQLSALRDGDVDPAVAVEELLRHAGPVQFTQRVLTADLEVDGHHIPNSTLVALLIGAANRDPGVFHEPDRLDLTRDPNPHLAFSSGIHHCLGAALARLEAESAIPAVLRALPGLTLAATPIQRETFVLRGMTALPVRWG